jgi:hypothetical protein
VERHEWMHVTAGLLLAAIIITFMWLIRMRQLLLQEAKDLDMQTLTPSDFCLMGKHMEFEKYDPESIKTEIENELKAEYGISDVVYVNPVYDISNYYQVFASYNETMKLKILADAHMKAYMDENNSEKAQYQLIIKSPTLCPKDAPKRSAGLLSKRPCVPDEIDAELAEL